LFDEGVDEVDGKMGSNGMSLEGGFVASADGSE